MRLGWRQRSESFATPLFTGPKYQLTNNRNAAIPLIKEWSKGRPSLSSNPSVTLKAG